MSGAPSGARIVEVWAPWCGPCRAMAPHVEALAGTYGDVEVEKVNADDDPDRVRALGVLAVPTLIAYDGEVELGRHTGALSRDALEELFQAARAGHAPDRRGLGGVDRVLRLGAGAALLSLGVALDTWVLLAAGGMAVFAGLHDRCPVWKQVVQLGKRLRNGA